MKIKIFSFIVMLTLIISNMPDIFAQEQKPLFDFDASTGSILQYNGLDMNVEFPSEIDGVTVKRLGKFPVKSGDDEIYCPPITTDGYSETYENMPKLTKIKIPDTVTTIGFNAFSGMNLKSLNIPETIQTVEQGAFSGNKLLESVTLPKNMSSLWGSGIFSGCQSLTKVNFHKQTNYIPASFFNSCQKLKKVEIPVGVKIVKNGTFSECINLNQITIPTTVEKIETEAFYK